MIEYLYHQLKEELEIKQFKKNQNEEQRERKKEQREKELKIMKLRAQFSECVEKREEGKGDAQWMTWKGKEIKETRDMDFLVQLQSNF